MTETFWNGLPTPATRGTAVVADAPEFPLYWARVVGLVGQRIPVVRVVLDGVNFGGGTDYLDNRDGHGWHKVTVGRGSPRYSHSSVAIEPGSFVPDGLHRLEVDRDEEGEVTAVRFVCAGGDDAPCHHYPDCECETSATHYVTDETGKPAEPRQPRPGHEDVPQGECWAVPWFDGGAYDLGDWVDLYDGPEDISTTNDLRSGPVIVQFDGDGVTFRYDEPARCREDGIDRPHPPGDCATDAAPSVNVADLIDRSSFGTPEAKRLRESVPPDVARRVVERAEALRATAAPTVLAEVAAERGRQDEKWGEQNHPDGTGPNAFVLRGTSINLDLRTGAELAHIFRRFCDEQHRRGEGTYLSILLEEVFEAAGEETREALRRELIQVAAVAVAWVEAIDRRTQEGATA